MEILIFDPHWQHYEFISPYEFIQHHFSEGCLLLSAVILKLWLNTRIIWMIFIKILKNITQIKNKILVVLDDMIADMLSNKRRNPVVTELRIRGTMLNIFVILLFCAKKYYTKFEALCYENSKQARSSTNCI